MPQGRHGLHPGGFRQIEPWLPTIQRPVRIVYGPHDRILPDVERTMARVCQDVPHAKMTALRDAGHFLQEDDPGEIARSCGFLRALGSAGRPVRAWLTGRTIRTVM